MLFFPLKLFLFCPIWNPFESSPIRESPLLSLLFSAFTAKGFVGFWFTEIYSSSSSSNLL